jgi:hypothetical protein
MSQDTLDQVIVWAMVAVLVLGSAPLWPRWWWRR